jgi:hypothetical protein
MVFVSANLHLKKSYSMSDFDFLRKSFDIPTPERFAQIEHQSKTEAKYVQLIKRTKQNIDSLSSDRLISTVRKKKIFDSIVFAFNLDANKPKHTTMTSSDSLEGKIHEIFSDLYKFSRVCIVAMMHHDCV